VRLRELVERINHTIEDLDWVREHAAIIQDELTSLESEAARVAMYRILLPPSLIAGLMGANISGIPGGDSSFAFALLCAGTFLLILAEILVLRFFKWL